MKNNLDGVLIVEGKSDVAFLSSFINGLFFTTNGYDVSENKLKFLQEVSKVQKIIILTDNDAAGEVIRNRIEKAINGTFVVKISGISRKNYSKKGVAEANRFEIEKLLSNYFVKEEFVPVSYDLCSLISLKNNPDELRNKIIEKYHLIPGNNKSLENQLNMLKISSEEIKEFVKGN